MLARFTGAGVMAAAITFGLVALMQFLIGREEIRLQPKRHFDIGVIFWEKEPPLKPNRSRPDKPKLVDVKPTEPPKPVPLDPTDTGGGITIETTFEPEDTGPPNREGFAGLDSIGETAIFRVQHRFPPRAQRSGCVIYGFTVTKTGGTRDIHVIDSSSRVFEREGRKAIEEYRYKPQVLNGRPVEAPLQSIRLVWELEGEPLPEHPACAGG